MLDSQPAKFIQLMSALLTIGTTIGGVLTGIQFKGDEWGKPLAATVFGFGFAVATLLFMLLVMVAYALIGKLRRTCPVCNGKGKVLSGYDALYRKEGAVCPKCNGDGLIW